MSLQSLIEQYGYLAVFVGTFLEGETILVLGGLSAKLGYLNLAWVMVAAFAGSLFGDQLYFFLGRYRGRSFIARHPKWEARLAKVHRLMARHETLFVLFFRFLYGLRTVTPFALGAGSISTGKFVVLNVAGALIWAVTVALLGWSFGHAAEVLLGDLRHYEALILGVAILAGAALWWWTRRRAAEARATQSSDPPRMQD